MCAGGSVFVRDWLYTSALVALKRRVLRSLDSSLLYTEKNPAAVMKSQKHKNRRIHWECDGHYRKIKLYCLLDDVSADDFTVISGVVISI